MPNPVAEVVERLRAHAQYLRENLPTTSEQHLPEKKARISNLEGAADLIERLSRENADHDAVHASHRKLVRKLDVALNGEAGAAPQASLCDVVAQLERLSRERDTASRALALISEGRERRMPDGTTEVWDIEDASEVASTALRSMQAPPRERDTGVPDGCVAVPAARIVYVRDALVMGDYDEAYHQLRMMVDPECAVYERTKDHWSDVEAVLSAAPQPPTEAV